MKNITLTEAKSDDYWSFREHILIVVDQLYDDIGEEYAIQIWESYIAGKDKNGFMTLAKKVYRANWENEHIGFVVLTSKRGGSVKSGPVFLFEKYQNQGLGKQLRQAIEDLVLSEGFRKVYCTTSIANRRGMGYLFSTGYKIEAHLTDHYRHQGDEIVFGKILKNLRPKDLAYEFVNGTENDETVDLRVVEATSPEISFCIEIFNKHFGVHFDEDAISHILRQSLVDSHTISYKQKPRYIYALRGSKSQKVYGVFFIALKRSGISKIFPLLTINNSNIIDLILPVLEKKTSTRKVVFFSPLFYKELYQTLKKQNYQTEGLLREPYSSGNDIIVLSKTRTALILE